MFRAEQQAHDLAFCLSLFTPTEKGLLKMQENFPCYQDKLCDEVVLKHLLVYISKTKKTGKMDIKV
jgi:condensin complex subunit 1